MSTLSPAESLLSREEIENLIERIGSGATEDTDDLSEPELELLRRYFDDDEVYGTLLDRLRNPSVFEP